MGKTMMGDGKIIGMVMFVAVIVSVAAGGPSENNHYHSHHHNHQQQKWWKWMSSGSGASSSVINPVVSSSIVLPLYGNVYPTGYYYVQLNVGQPSKPYFLDPDTGSDLTWLQCDAPCVRCTRAPHPYYKPNNDLVPCKDPLCASLHHGDYNCESPEQCDYQVDYADGGSSLGVLLNDMFAFNMTSGSRINPRLALGCGYDQLPGESHHPLDGVLGLGKGKASIVSQLRSRGLVRNVVGHCLSARGGGFLFFGDEVYDSSRIVWTPMALDRMKHYAAGNGELIFGGKATGFKNLYVVFDSGSSFSYLNSLTYQGFISILKKELKGKPLKEAKDDYTLPLCWKDSRPGSRPFKTINDVKKYFKNFALSFAHGWKSKAHFELAPESYLITSSKGSVCLGVLNGTEAGLQNVNLIGDISMQDKMVIYDNEKQAIGWRPTNCDRPPKASSTIM